MKTLRMRRGSGFFGMFGDFVSTELPLQQNDFALIFEDL